MLIYKHFSLLFPLLGSSHIQILGSNNAGHAVTGGSVTKVQGTGGNLIWIKLNVIMATKKCRVIIKGGIDSIWAIFCSNSKDLFP